MVIAAECSFISNLVSAEEAFYIDLGKLCPYFLTNYLILAF